MESTYYHLLINELPLTGVVIGIVMLITGLLIKNRTVKRTALVLFIAAALITIPSYLTGIKASESFHLPGDSAGYLKTHIEIAREFIRMMALLGLLSVITLVLDFRESKNGTKIFYVITLAAALFMFFMTQSIGTSGREINHPELRNDTLK